MATVALETIKNRILTLGFGASLALCSLGFVGSAEARIAAGTPRTDGLSTVCGYFQDMYDSVPSKGIGARAVNQNNDAYAKNQQTKDTAETEWNKAGCNGAYGNIGAIQAGNQISVVNVTPNLAAR